VFVYGMLRGGGTQPGRMAGEEFVTPATVLGRLYRIDWYPGVVLDDVGDEISGEAYAVGPSLLAQLDAFEGSEYRRVRVEVNCGGGHRSPFTAWDWEWLDSSEESRRMTGGDWFGKPEG
jgi:gamma-glutamylcyclotransferase (GGCT)/AIG2-like uncharacterized protein YtfP